MKDDLETPSPEHLLKGQPRVRFRSPEDSLAVAKEGVHRWWWEFLRLSKDYWLVCQTSQKGKVETQDKELAKVYKAFGNVYNCTFDDWWIDRGSWVFREQDQFPKVKEVVRNPRERASHKYPAEHVWIDIPLKLSRRTIQRQIGRILDLHEEQRLNNRLEMSTSMFKLNPVQYRLHTLRKMHELHSLHRELVEKPAALRAKKKDGAYAKRADLFRIGKLLQISPSNESLRGAVDEIFKRQNRMRASVSRLLKRSELLIANVEQGVFPSFKPVKPQESMRFNSRQLEMHKELEAEWWLLELTSNMSAGKIDDARRVHYEEEQRGRQFDIVDRSERVVKYS
jgi:hypothetical protein